MPKAREPRFRPSHGQRPVARGPRRNLEKKAAIRAALEGRGPAEPPEKLRELEVPEAAIAVQDAPQAPVQSGVALPKTIVVSELAQRLGVGPVDVLKELVQMGVMVSINQSVDYETATLVASELGVETRPEEEAAPVVEEEVAAEVPAGPAAKVALWEEEDESLLRTRPPVVVIMGHVDHGKTSLLDAIRQTNVTAQEAGGITQHIGAYQVEKNGRKITFLDTPGHEAFTAMRARGARVTDVAVLVVAADDGVQPQTIEAISHARAANVPIVVALNKIDKADANPDNVKAQLADQGVTIEEYGGDVPLVAVSAKTKQGIDDLLDVILLVADIQNLRANPDRAAIGTVIEAHLDKGRGPVATVLVQNGSLDRGDIVVAGKTFGKVRAMIDDKGRKAGRAEPSRPVEILGLPEVPEAGDIFRVVADEKSARAATVANARAIRARAAGAEAPASLEDLFAAVKEGKAKELKLVLKADVQGSLEAIRNALAKLPQDEVAVNVIHAAVGEITESDVNLAATAGAVVIGFNNRIDVAGRRAAEAGGVEVRLYKVIYELLDDVQKALTGMLEPEMVEAVLGHAEVRQLFRAGKTTIAGCMVVDGVVQRSARARALRGGERVFDGLIASLRRVKDDVREVRAGLECGIVLEGFNDVAVGDIIEGYALQPKPRG
jgi:translation initiation factor IF-2